jgi:hypothetical protein
VAHSGIDIVVTSPTGHADLVVEVKLSRELDAATAQLRDYMRGVGAPVGLVVGRDEIRILREMYLGHPSIQVIGVFPTELAHDLQISNGPSGMQALEFEERVQRWLESLLRGESVADEPLLTALREHVLPVIEEGTVRAAGPRAHIASR